MIQNVPHRLVHVIDPDDAPLAILTFRKYQSGRAGTSVVLPILRKESRRVNGRSDDEFVVDGVGEQCGLAAKAEFGGDICSVMIDGA